VHRTDSNTFCSTSPVCSTSSAAPPAAPETTWPTRTVAAAAGTGGAVLRRVVPTRPERSDAAQASRTAGGGGGGRSRSWSLPAAGSWGELVARLDSSGRFVRWGGLEPALAGADLDGLREQLQPGVDPARSDELIGAVLRLAAVDGHDEPDAVLVLLHLLAAGVRVVAKQLSDLTCDPLGLVVGELAAQIRSFPSTHTRRGLAGTLLMDTKAALLRELRPHRTRAHRDVYEVPIDPTDPTTLALLFGTTAPAHDDELDLLEVLLWAQRTGVVDPVDVALLLHAERSRDEPGPLRLTLERCWGQSGRTLRRRRLRTLAALQAASSDYLRDCA